METDCLVKCKVARETNKAWGFLSHMIMIMHHKELRACFCSNVVWEEFQLMGLLHRSKSGNHLQGGYKSSRRWNHCAVEPPGISGGPKSVSSSFSKYIYSLIGKGWPSYTGLSLASETRENTKLRSWKPRSHHSYKIICMATVTT